MLYYQGRRNRGGGRHLPPQILTDQLPYSNQMGGGYSPHFTTCLHPPRIFIPYAGSEYRIASDSGSSSNQLYFKRVSNKGDVCWPIYAPFIRNFTVQPFLLSDVYFGRDCARLYCHSAAR